VPKLLSIAVPVNRRSMTKKARPQAPAAIPETETPVIAHERAPNVAAPRAKHRFRVGQRLRLVNAGAGMGRAGGTCRVVALMPRERDIFSYRVRNESENFERIVAEADLAPLEAQLP
jgi:hypothetical protein